MRPVPRFPCRSAEAGKGNGTMPPWSSASMTRPTTSKASLSEPTPAAVRASGSSSSSKGMKSVLCKRSSRPTAHASACPAVQTRSSSSMTRSRSRIGDEQLDSGTYQVGYLASDGGGRSEHHFVEVKLAE